MTSTRTRPVAQGGGFVLVIVAGITLAYLGSGYVLQLGGDALALGMAAMGLDFLVGFTGRVSFGQAAWLAVGGFASGYLLLHGWDVITATLATIGIIIVLSGVMGAVATITGGLAFAIVTLAQGVIIYTIVNHLKILGAGVGLFGIPLPKVAGQSWLGSQRSLFLLAFVLAVICFLVLRALVASPAGRFCQAIRDDDVRARSIGVEVQRYQLLAFVVSSVIAGIGGVAFVVLNGGIEPSLGAWDQSGLILVMLIIGGTRTLYGGFIGAFIYVFAQNYLTQSFANSWQVYMGGIFVLVVLLLPGGIAGGVRLGLTRLVSSAGAPQRRRGGPDSREREIESDAGETVIGVPE